MQTSIFPAKKSASDKLMRIGRPSPRIRVFFLPGFTSTWISGGTPSLDRLGLTFRGSQHHARILHIPRTQILQLGRFRLSLFGLDQR